MTHRPHVLIVGAGIIGASIAWHLAAAGAAVTVLDAGAPGGVATRKSWAWINASWGNPEPYFRLRVRAMDEWRRIEHVLPAIRVAWSGGLIWDLPPGELDAFAAQHSSWGYGIRRVDRAEAKRIEPRLVSPPDFALHVAGEGATDPLAAARALLRAAQDLGVKIVLHTHVRALSQRAGRIGGVETDDGRIDADMVVVAAGAETSTLAAMTGLAVPMTAPPGLLIVSKPHSKLLNGLVLAPDIHARQTEDGRLIAGSDFGGSDPGDDAVSVATQLFDKLRNLMQGGTSLEFDRHMIGHRPMPADGFPIVGALDRIPGLYVAVTHSGITLAPAIGRFAAEEILTGKREVLLAPYGVERFAKDAA